MKNKFFIEASLLLLVILFTGCTKGDIKNNYCGVHIDFRYCKCAFHNQYCDAIGMSKDEAKEHVYEAYDKWLNPEEEKIEELIEEEVEGEKKYGIIEEDGNIYINSKPGETLSISTEDLPEWARGKIATVGAQIGVVGAPDTIIEGDPNVSLDGLPIARLGDATAHGGSIVEGSDKIYVNGVPVATIGDFAVDPMVTGSVPNVGGQIIGNVN